MPMLRALRGSRSRGRRHSRAVLAEGLHLRINMTDQQPCGSSVLAVAIATLALSHLGCGTNERAAGPDGNLWFTERGDLTTPVASIARITLTGEITEFSLPSGSQPWWITAGPDGAMWFTDYGAHMIGRIALDGTIQEFPLPTATAQPVGITLGGDGNLWFTESTTTTNVNPTGNVASITPGGAVTEFPVGTEPSEVAAGPDGNIWYVAFYHSAIGRMTLTGQVTEFPLPQSSFPHGIAAGPDGALWVTEATGVGRLSLDGAQTFFAVPTSGADEYGEIVAGTDGALWFASDTGGTVDRVTTGGAVSTVPLDDGIISPVTGIAAAGDGSVWLTDGWNDVIVRFRP